MSINQVASVVNLARATMLGLDDHKQFTEVATPTLKLLLQTLIDLGTADNPTAKKIEAAHSGLVSARITGIERR